MKQELYFAKLSDSINKLYMYTPMGGYRSTIDSGLEVRVEGDISSIIPAQNVPLKFRPLLPNTYEFVFTGNSDAQDKSGLLGKGGHGSVYLVREKSTGTLWAAKFWKTGKGIDPDDRLEDILEWKRLYGNKLEARFYENVIIKTLIRGRDLQGWYTKFQLFDGSEKSNAALLALSKLLIKMWKSKKVVGDLNPGNLMYDEESLEWVVVDGRDFNSYESCDEAALKGAFEIFPKSGFTTMEQEELRLKIQSFLELIRTVHSVSR